jgi:hypothetical protein
MHATDHGLPRPGMGQMIVIREWDNGKIRWQSVPIFYGEQTCKKQEPFWTDSTAYSQNTYISCYRLLMVVVTTIWKVQGFESG